MTIRRLATIAASIAVVGVIALLALFATSGAASAARATDNAAAPTRVAGKITAIAAPNFTLETRQGSVQVATGSNTWFVVENGGSRAEGTLADLAVGDKVAVAGTGSVASGINARLVAEGNGRKLAQLARQRANKVGKASLIEATVTAINGPTLTVTGPRGQQNVAVNTDAGTVFLKNGFSDLSAITVGDKVHIVPRFGKLDTAAAVIEAGAGNTVVLGRVQAVNGNTLTLKTAERGAFTVNLGSSTGYEKLAAAGQAPATASLSDISQGSIILAYGTKASGSKTLDSSAILIVPLPQRSSNNVAP